MRAFIFTCIATLTLANLAVAEEQRIGFPSEYRTAYTNYLSLDRVQNPDQTIRLFANDIAMQGVRANGEFPDGSILVAEVYKAKKAADGKVLKSSLGRRIRDKFALIAVMEKRAGWGADFAPGLRNGDWDFAAFKPDGSVAKKDLNGCRACHSPLTDLRHVFSYEHLK
ncbi:MAG: cytochrome P460 family protein [Gammaproteobacteria bacterium]|nr:cytochrome P460 family protein [Gammaproteobacteria bacterium]